MHSRHPGNNAPGAVRGAEHAAMRHHSRCLSSIVQPKLSEVATMNPTAKDPQNGSSKWILISVISTLVSGEVLRAFIRF